MAGLIGLLAGSMFGLVVLGWWLLPLKADAAPHQLSLAAKEEYLRITIEAYGQNGDSALAYERYQVLGAEGQLILERIGKDPGPLPPALILDFTDRLQVKAQQTAAVQPGQGAESTSRIQPLLIVMFAILSFSALAALAIWWANQRKKNLAAQSPQVWEPIEPLPAEVPQNSAQSEDKASWAFEFGEEANNSEDKETDPPIE